MWRRQAYCEVRWQNGNVTKRNRFLTIASEYLASTKQKEEDGDTSDVGQQSWSFRWQCGTSARAASSKGKKEGERVTTKIFPRAFQPDEEASPEVGQPKRPKRSAWETKWGGKRLRENDGSSSPTWNPRAPWKSYLRKKKKEKFAAPLQYSSCVLFLSRYQSPAISEVRPYAKIRVLFRNKKSITAHNPSFRSRLFPLPLALVPSRNRIAPLGVLSRGSRMRGTKGGKKREEGKERSGKGERSSRVSDSRDATPDIGPCGAAPRERARAQKRIMYRCKCSSRRYHQERDTVPKAARANSHARRPWEQLEASPWHSSPRLGSLRSSGCIMDRVHISLVN